MIWIDSNASNLPPNGSPAGTCSLKYSVSALNLSLLKPAWFSWSCPHIAVVTHSRAFRAYVRGILRLIFIVMGQSNAVPGATGVRPRPACDGNRRRRNRESRISASSQENPSNADAQNALGQLLCNRKRQCSHRPSASGDPSQASFGHRTPLSRASVTEKGSLDAAIAEFRATVRLRPSSRRLTKLLRGL